MSFAKKILFFRPHSKLEKPLFCIKSTIRSFSKQCMQTDPSIPSLFNVISILSSTYNKGISSPRYIFYNQNPKLKIPMFAFDIWKTYYSKVEDSRRKTMWMFSRQQISKPDTTCRLRWQIFLLQIPDINHSTLQTTNVGPLLHNYKNISLRHFYPIKLAHSVFSANKRSFSHNAL